MEKDKKSHSVFKDTHETKAHRNLGGTLQKPEEIIARRIKVTNMILFFVVNWSSSTMSYESK